MVGTITKKILKEYKGKCVLDAGALAAIDDYESNKFNSITKFQKYDLISCPLNIMDFINKVNLMFSKFQFADKSKIDFLNYTINLNSREISNNNNKIKLTEREKDFLLFLKKSKKPQTIKNILKSFGDILMKWKRTLLKPMFIDYGRSF